MKYTIEGIIENDWYKTATQEQMVVALSHLKMNTLNEFTNVINNVQGQQREICLQECADINGWE